MLLIGKPSISMGHGFHGYVSHNQRVGPMAHLAAERWLRSFPASGCQWSIVGSPFPPWSSIPMNPFAPCVACGRWLRLSEASHEEWGFPKPDLIDIM